MTIQEIITVPANPDAPFDPPKNAWYATWDPECAIDGEDAPWGVYEASCPGCGMTVMHVARIDDVNNGTVSVDDKDSLCTSCQRQPTPN